MRDDDPNGNPGKPLDNELRDIHHRIDALKEEQESQYKTLLERLHNIEVRLAAGWRFPVAGWASVLLVVGAVGATYLRVEVGAANAEKALALIEDHLKQAPTHRYNVESLTKFADEMRDRLPHLEADVDSLKGRIVGNTSEGWHRRDHELYAEVVAARLAALDQRMTAQEQRSVQRDGWWQRLWDSGLLKGQK